MPTAEIERLRAGVISYYEEYIEPERFGKKLMARLPSISELMVDSIFNSGPAVGASLVRIPLG